MKIALLTAYIGQRSAGLWAATEAYGIALAGVGMNVTILGLEDGNKWAARSHQAARVKRCPVVGPRSLGFSAQLRQALFALAPDLVHVHGLWAYPSWVSLDWSNKERKARIVSPHGMLDSWALRRSAWKKRIACLLYEASHLRGAACLHALSEAEVRAIRSFGLRNPICVIPNGVCLPPPTSPDSADKGVRTLLFLGRLHPKKGVRELLEGWSLVRREAAENCWRLVIAGWGEEAYWLSLKRYVAEENLDTSVEFVGPVYDAAKDQIFRTANAFILPSFSEGLPVAVLEAWSYGLPVVITPECNFPAALCNQASIEVSPTIRGISDGLRQLFSLTEAERRRIGMAGRSLINQHFTAEIVASRLQSVYHWVVGGGTPPPFVETQ